jgi:hypothetical protein
VLLSDSLSPEIVFEFNILAQVPQPKSRHRFHEAAVQQTACCSGSGTAAAAAHTERRQSHHVASIAVAAARGSDGCGAKVQGPNNPTSCNKAFKHMFQTHFGPFRNVLNTPLMFVLNSGVFFWGRAGPF